jgi:aminoglycoside/choline kinase family phosphotransferase
MAAVSQLIEKSVIRFPRFARQEIIVHPLEKGGSDRKFYRIAVSDQHSLILAKYGRQREENRHYVAIAQFLASVGVRDLGDRDLWSYRDEPWPVRRDLYHSALDQLFILHTRAHTATPVEPPQLQVEFNADLYRWEQNYFLENCLVRHFGLDADAVGETCNRARLSQIADQLAALPRCYVHRDFQSQNIVIKDGTACFIDFQGMRPGLPQYDLASVLYDPYVRLPETERTELLNHYLAALTDHGQTPAPDFTAVYNLCAMQRLMQALGAYGFLGHVKERPHFLEHIPAALASLREVLEHVPGVENLRACLAALKA